jgi:pimeloyl-ACP methyl ester carboxylesterase
MEVTMDEFDPAREANGIAYSQHGRSERLLLLSGFPQTRRLWNKIIPLLAAHFETIAADLPSFGGSAALPVPATTENVARLFHEFVSAFGIPLHVVANDFGAWVAYSWALLFPADFRTLPLIDAGIPGVTLTEVVQLSDFKRKWNFIFQLLPELPAVLTEGKEELYCGWWFRNKVHDPSAISPEDAGAYARSYARVGRTDATMDYRRRILEDIEFNRKHFSGKLPIPLLAVGGEHSIPAMGESLMPYFREVTPVVVRESGHFVPEEQPRALVDARKAFVLARSVEGRLVHG